MSDLKIAVGGLDYFAEQSTTQFVIPAGAGATFTNAQQNGVYTNICTVTFNAPHGLTFTPSANVLPNYFIKFGGSTAGLTGTGVLVGNTFRILSIPTTSSITIYSTITAATVTSLTGIPVFYPVFQQALLSGAATNTLASGTTGSFATTGGYPYYGSVQCSNLTLGANCVALYNSDNTAAPLDASTGVTPSTAPAFRTMLAASTTGQLRFGPYDQIAASGTTATSYISIVN
jgi:hypothetical protein